MCVCVCVRAQEAMHLNTKIVTIEDIEHERFPVLLHHLFKQIIECAYAFAQA